MYLLVIKQLSIMLIIAFSGFIAARAFKWGKSEQQFTSRLLLMFINPCLILNRFNMEYSPEKLRGFLISGGFALVIHFVMIFIALLILRSKDEKEKELDAIDRNAAVFTNCGFVGIPLIQGVFGDDGVFYLVGYITVFNVLLWTIGYRLLAGKTNFKKIITNPNILSVIIGMIVFILPWNLPEVLGKSISYVGAMNTPCAMILLGFLFATFKRNSEVSYTKRVIKLCIVRHVVMLLIALGLAYAFFRLFPNIPDSRMISYVVFIAALCPVGMSVSSFSVMFNKDESYAALLCLATSVIAVFSLPLSVALAERLF